MEHPRAIQKMRRYHQSQTRELACLKRYSASNHGSPFGVICDDNTNMMKNQSDAPSNQSSDNVLTSKSTPPNSEKKTLSNRSRRAHQAKNQLLKKLEHLKAKSEIHKRQQEVKTTDEPAKAETTNNAAKTETPVKTVTKLLERTKKTQKDKNPEEPRRKLTHVSSFVREKTTGSIEYDDGNVKGKSLGVAALNAS